MSRSEKVFFVCFFAVLSALCGGISWLTATVASPPQCHEEDACWNPASMGNHEGFVCHIEPSDTPEGFEVIQYHDTSNADSRGFRVPCPQ